MSMLPKILNQVTIQEWFIISKDIVRVRKSELLEFNIDDPINDILKHMTEKGIN